MNPILTEMVDEIARQKQQIAQLQGASSQFAVKVAQAIGMPLSPTMNPDDILAALRAKLTTPPVANATTDDSAAPNGGHTCGEGCSHEGSGPPGTVDPESGAVVGFKPTPPVRDTQARGKARP